MTAYEHQILKKINGMLDDYHHILRKQTSNKVFYLPDVLFDEIHELAKEIDHADAIYYYIPSGKVLLEPERNNQTVDNL
jgi:hypothetical protein